MNVRGERIIVFGDSLSRHGNTEIWDVDAGANRSSSAPGDLLASLLAEQGAEAVRVNARVSRSAWNFWSRENTAHLISQDVAFRPTKVVFVLGTNDVGLNTTLDREAFGKLRDTYKRMGAEIWAIGPFSNTTKDAQGVDIVARTMRDVFGSRFIDGRPISILIHPGGDGLHYSTQSARVLALAMADALISKMSPKTLWTSIGLGAIGVAGTVAIAYAIKQRKRNLGEALALAAIDDKNTKQRLRELIADDDPGALDVAQDLALEHGIKLSELANEPKDGRKFGPASGIFNLSSEALKSPHPNVTLADDRVTWDLKWDPRTEVCRVEFNAFIGSERVGGRADRIGQDSREFIQEYQGSQDYCRRAATADAWAMAKAIKESMTSVGPYDRRSQRAREKAEERINQAIQRDNSEPEELYGLGAPKNETKIWRLNPVTGLWIVVQGTVLEENAQEYLRRFEKDEPGVKFKISKRKPRAPKSVVSASADLDSETYHKYVEEHLSTGRKFGELTRDPDPASMLIAEDFLEERGLRLRDLTMDEHADKVLKNKLNVGGSIALSPLDPADAPVTYLRWTIKPAGTHADDPSAVVDWEIVFNNERIRIDGDFPRRAKDVDELLRRVVADAWKGAKVLKELPPDATPSHVHHAFIDALYSEHTTPDGKRSYHNADIKPHLYGPLGGVNIVDGKRSNESEAAIVRSGARQVPCKSGLDRNQLATCWTRGLRGDLLPGGKAAGRKPGDFDRDQLKIGTRVELEHTPDRKIAREIAMDHLAEDPAYYTKLARVHLDGPSMLKTIAAESQSPDECARRAEAWASSESKPPSIRALVKACKGATVAMIKQARETRERLTKERYKRLERGLKGTKIGAEFRRKGSKVPWTVTEIVKPERMIGTLKVGETVRVTDGKTFVEITNAQGAWIDGQGRRWNWLGGGIDGLEGARRRPEQETRRKEDDPGSRPPRYGDLHIGREKADGYKDLPWKRVIAEAKKEREKNPDGGANLRLSMRVGHAPDAHTPYTYVDWDPLDEKGAIAFAKQLIEDGGAMYADVRAFAERPYMQGDRRPPKGAWTLASFEDDKIPLEGLRGGSDRDDIIAHAIKDSASRAPRWGDRKVFVSDVYEQLQIDGRDDGASLDELKSEIARLHKAGKLKLARADLVAAMPSEKVEASEIDARGGTFHFVDVGG